MGSLNGGRPFPRRRSSSIRSASLCLALVTLLCSPLVSAQSAAPAQDVQSANPNLVPPTTPEPQQACFPACRDGHLCHQGNCISACNPPCAAGSHCTGQGICTADTAGQPATVGPQPQHQASPPVPPSEQNAPVPPDAWQPKFPEPEHLHPYGTRYYTGLVGLQLSLGGTATVDTERSGGGTTSRDFDLDAAGALEATLLFRITETFVLGPGIRLMRTGFEGNNDSAGSLDLLAVPAFRFPAGTLEFLLPIPVGLTFGGLPLDSEDAGTGAGFTIGFTPGIMTWLTPQLGLYGQVGATWHFRTYSDDVDSVLLFRPVLTLGMTFSN